MAENPEKANIQGVEIQLAKINNNGRKANRASLGRIFTGGTPTSPTDPEKVRADKRKIKNVDRQIDASTREKNMHESMKPEKS